MQLDEDQARTREFAEAALAWMAKLAVPPLPRNYRLFFGYFEGTHPDLAQAIDRVEKDGQGFTAAILEQFHERYFGVDRQERAVHNAALCFGELAERIKALLGEAGQDIEQYGSTLGNFNDSLERNDQPEHLRILVGELVAETGRMVERNKDLESRLSRASDEMTALREDLVNVRKEALNDPLTKIANRKCFDDTLREAASHSFSTGEPLSLLMLDIDHFKIFNDRFGHQVGDEVLKIVARTLVRSVKGQDLPARYGGEEFTVILPNTYLEDAATLAGQIRANVATKHIVRKITGEDFGILTLSIGVAQYRLGERLANFVGRADEALYAAKRDGRDRVSVACEPVDNFGTEALASRS